MLPRMPSLPCKRCAGKYNYGGKRLSHVLPCALALSTGIHRFCSTLIKTRRGHLGPEWEAAPDTSAYTLDPTCAVVGTPRERCAEGDQAKAL